MTLIKFDADPGMVDRLKMHTGERVASKAYKFAAEDVPDMSAEIRDLHRIVDDQKLEIRRLKAVIEQARSAAALLLEKTSQADAFA